MKFEDLTKEQQNAVMLSRGAAGIKDEEIKNDDNVKIVVNMSKEELNKKERERIISSGGLRPNTLFSYYLYNWDGKLDKITIKYPASSVAKRFVLISYDKSGAMNFNIADIIDRFIDAGLIKNFDEDNYKVPELIEFASFLTETINNPSFQ